ncbi:C-type lectin domain family 14 member A [Nerophis ophidion]|uniref:C-type lectin domain family 14 member A n=1 Tax=Nerophis ophidion TaxID=159077 RepID=UPI002ADF23B7|nr:C-type lectin domain family 14 member A [Nerophis ophidion]XP_061761992.1 C-type lectin domain family 14 member A [Nerophis ophidion]
MTPLLRFSGIQLWTVTWVTWVTWVTSVSAGSEPEALYELHQSKVSFERAQEECRPNQLATFATRQELAQILHVLSSSDLQVAQRPFWVGLRKAKNQCVVPSLPLRGFRWTSDGRSEVHESQWVEEPEHTCTSVLCAALLTQQDRSTITKWGLIPLNCKTHNSFICKLASGQEELEPATPEPTQVENNKPAEPDVSTPGHAEPETPVPKLAEPKPTGPETSAPKLDEPQSSHPEQTTPAKGEPEPTGPEPIEPTQEQNPKSGSRQCSRPVVPGARFLSLDPAESSRIQVDCWSLVQLDLYCLGPPTIWRLINGAVANLSSVCTPCGPGFLKDDSGECVDVDECVGAHKCSVACINTVGSYACECTNRDGRQNPEDSAVCAPTETGTAGPFSGFLVPVLVALAVLVVLV